MTTTTMDLTSDAPARADRKTPAPVTWGEHLSSSASASMWRVQRAQAVVASMDGQPARGKPPPALLERFVTRVMVLLFAVAVVRTFGWDLLALIWRTVF